MPFGDRQSSTVRTEAEGLPALLVTAGLRPECTAVDTWVRVVGSMVSSKLQSCGALAKSLGTQLVSTGEVFVRNKVTGGVDGTSA